MIQKRFLEDAPPRSDFAWEEAIEKAERAIRHAESLADIEACGWEPEQIGQVGGADIYTIHFCAPFMVCRDCGSLGVEPEGVCNVCGFGG